MDLRWTRSAWKDLQGLPSEKQATVLEVVASYAANPFGRHPDAKPLVGEKDGVRLRVGKWRVILHRGKGFVEVRAVAHRREAYR